ncbi:hypothetical protein CB0940_12145 [Cercospora beticola]|uniref:Uncharacterized protein n=1 Tax=Cercospora beticola TaxID=122368 RepID=A0A2G5GIA8_CERBT|nr:hypothetical protein CB0940_12145 [Cercospora beticola]PIA80018.1 hypothetical protein CB0940_12145 [Cercospora beticola]WPB07645.1 hypothetical protein RHO25_012306 [Cercospora beticola]CAK1356551.1 unnamed protein product [Cercospora beticola]
MAPTGPGYTRVEENLAKHGTGSKSEEFDDVGYSYRRPDPAWTKVVTGNALAILLSLCALILALVASFGIYERHAKFEVPSERINLGTCGRNWQEAEANGCVYDVMMTAWLKPQCYDKELSDSFFYRDSANWTFYRDPEGKDVMPHEELFQGRYEEYWVQGTYHFSHCSYIWAKQLRQMGKKPMTLDSKFRNWYHTLHCANMLAEANVTYIGGRASSHAKLGTNSIDCIVGDWMTFESIPAELQRGAGPSKEE